MLLRSFKYILYCLVVSFNIQTSLAQTPLLERPITLRFNNEKISVVLDNIAKQGGFSFSYNSDIFDVNNRGDITVTNKPVREVLNLIFRGTITYKVKGNYIILQKNNQEEQKKNLILCGYVIDKQTDKPLEKVTIYDRKSLSSTVSNQYGFYRIKLSVSDLPIKLSISKTDYEKHSIVVKSPQTTYEIIGLNPVIQQYVELPQAIFEDNSMEQMDSLRSLNSNVETKPISEIIAPPFPDITDENLFPTSPIIDSTLYESRWDKFIKNIGKLLVSRSQRINAQNIKDSLSRDFQFSVLPFLGTNRLLSGSIKNDVSVNLLMGYSGGVRKLEIGGILNGVRRDVEGIQVAGVGNIVGGKVSGVQVGGVFNIAGHLESGLQVSPIFNVIIKESNGFQVSTFNFAHKVLNGGKQIGLLNICDSTETTPIGLFSFVGSGNGYKRLELSVDENQTAYFTFKTGVRKFYNVLSLQYNFTRTKEVFGLGYGIGRAYEMGRAWMLNTDLTANVLIEYDDVSPNVGTLWKLDINLEKQIARNAAVTFGPSIKYLLIDEYNSGTWTAKPFSKIPSYRSLSSNFNSTFWIGFQMGIRIRSR
jgi:hypothetical protein